MRAIRSIIAGFRLNNVLAPDGLGFALSVDGEYLVDNEGNYVVGIL